MARKSSSFLLVMGQIYNNFLPCRIECLPQVAYYISGVLQAGIKPQYPVVGVIRVKFLRRQRGAFGQDQRFMTTPANRHKDMPEMLAKGDNLRPALRAHIKAQQSARALHLPPGEGILGERLIQREQYSFHPDMRFQKIRSEE